MSPLEKKGRKREEERESYFSNLYLDVYIYFDKKLWLLSKKKVVQLLYLKLIILYIYVIFYSLDFFITFSF